MTSPAEVQARIELVRIWHQLEPQARSVLLKIARRLRAGQKEYGTMDVVGDGRNYFDEACEEALDFAVYHAMHELKRELG